MTRREAVLAGLAAALCAAAACGLACGAVRLPLDAILRMLAGDGDIEGATVFWQLRVPRVLLAMLVGATLGLSGAMLQGLLRNPLADPALAGVSAGAALGAAGVILLAPLLTKLLGGIPGEAFLPAAAFATALVTALAVYRLASSAGGTDIATLLLAGIAVNALAGAFLGIATIMADDAQLRSLTFWTLGSLGTASWETLAWTTPACAALIAGAPFFAGGLNALALGEAEAGHLGFRLGVLKRGILGLTAAGVGATVACSGTIGFVGLVVPHLIRLWIGPDHRTLLPASALAGATLVVLSDTAARTLAAPAELPIGILTSAFGAPVFLWMILRDHSRRLSA